MSNKHDEKGAKAATEVKHHETKPEVKPDKPTEKPEPKPKPEATALVGGKLYLEMVDEGSNQARVRLELVVGGDDKNPVYSLEFTSGSAIRPEDADNLIDALKEFKKDTGK